ncbi:hypothetical protein J6590_016393 [Homalodisca vitripennis]|nr:hypothetical protein J6590_016393 [Homalodisca vitripennis]
MQQQLTSVMIYPLAGGANKDCTVQRIEVNLNDLTGNQLINQYPIVAIHFHKLIFLNASPLALDESMMSKDISRANSVRTTHAEALHRSWFSMRHTRRQTALDKCDSICFHPTSAKKNFEYLVYFGTLLDSNVSINLVY